MCSAFPRLAFGPPEDTHLLTTRPASPEHKPSPGFLLPPLATGPLSALQAPSPPGQMPGFLAGWSQVPASSRPTVSPWERSPVPTPPVPNHFSLNSSSAPPGNTRPKYTAVSLTSPHQVHDRLTMTGVLKLLGSPILLDGTISIHLHDRKPVVVHDK